MKRISTIIIFCSVLFMVACQKNNGGSGGPTGGGGGNTPFTPNCNGAAIQFTANVAPLIASSCASASCHGAGSSSGPGALTTYAQINAVKAQIRASVLSGSMPKNATLTAAQRNSIICWIDAGAPNN